MGLRCIDTFYKRCYPSQYIKFLFFLKNDEYNKLSLFKQNNVFK